MCQSYHSQKYSVYLLFITMLYKFSLKYIFTISMVIIIPLNNDFFFQGNNFCIDFKALKGKVNNNQKNTVQHSAL